MVKAPTPAPPSPWLRIDGAAERLRCSESTVRRLISGGKLPVYRPGGLVRIHVDDIDAYVRSGSTEAA